MIMNDPPSLSLAHLISLGVKICHSRGRPRARALLNEVGVGSSRGRGGRQNARRRRRGKKEEINISKISPPSLPLQIQRPSQLRVGVNDAEGNTSAGEGFRAHPRPLRTGFTLFVAAALLFRAF